MSEEFSRVVSALRQYFGFTSFRPLQEEIIREALGGRDVFALLPTGGGKSLCFQLPAIVRPGLTVVVSPLIALMKDQVDALNSAGVAATFLNSSLSPEEARARIQRLHQGDYKLLYVAPERLMLPGFLDDIARWNPSLFAIDEAHCISEWGHDFRPEYRQLAQLKARFSAAPLMALTATATERVREDILRQLKLRDPARFVASFNRPNLSYRVALKQSGYDQVLALARARRKEAGIVYCQSRKGAEGLASKLRADGIQAAPYHAGMEAADRARNQERFLRDEIQVICATIAFGMGINKPNVRFVVHYDLPKNLEGYYQETGRAGRDGLPGECLLLFSPGDVVKCERFIEQKPDPREQAIARDQLRVMSHYAESHGCRRRTLLGYFGELYPEENCSSCDNCITPRARWDVTIPAQKLLSCVYRIREQNNFSTGLTHVIEVLTGAATQKIRDWGHDRISTYGIGRDLSRLEWGVIGRELVRLGYLSQDASRFGVVEVTDLGMKALRARTPVEMARPLATRGDGGTAAASSDSRPRGRDHTPGDIECDEALFERLRRLRKGLADERDVPAYIILSDVALRHMARRYPVTEVEMLRISGVGEKKMRDFGAQLIAEIRAHLDENPRLEFTEGSGAGGPSRGLPARFLGSGKNA
ncbi:MAG TPA: DNA helicase RecQ [Verrucomicrobiales bacterium]|nr:DNA helicase RecQ [Verrucomicrobiales bacterium]